VQALSMSGVVAGTTLPVRRYAPQGSGVLPVVVWYQGGGYMLGDLDCYDGVCRQLAVDVCAVVVAGMAQNRRPTVPATCRAAQQSLRFQDRHRRRSSQVAGVCCHR
jgi:alpha/beta hydrolase fold